MPAEQTPHASGGDFARGAEIERLKALVFGRATPDDERAAAEVVLARVERENLERAALERRRRDELDAAVAARHRRRSARRLSRRGAAFAVVGVAVAVVVIAVGISWVAPGSASLSAGTVAATPGAIDVRQAGGDVGGGPYSRGAVPTGAAPTGAGGAGTDADGSGATGDTSGGSGGYVAPGYTAGADAAGDPNDTSTFDGHSQTDAQAAAASTRAPATVFLAAQTAADRPGVAIPGDTMESSYRLLSRDQYTPGSAFAAKTFSGDVCLVVFGGTTDFGETCQDARGAEANGLQSSVTTTTILNPRSGSNMVVQARFTAVWGSDGSFSLDASNA